MPISCNVGDVSHNAKPFVNINGIWYPVKKSFVNVGGAWRQSFSSGIPYTSTYYTESHPDLFKYTVVFAEPVLIQPADYINVNGYTTNTYPKRIRINTQFSDHGNKSWFGTSYVTDQNPIRYEQFGYQDNSGEAMTVSAHLTQLEIILYYQTANATTTTLAGTLSVGGHTCDLTQSGEIEI